MTRSSDAATEQQVGMARASGTRFVRLTADRLLAELRSIGAAITKSGGTYHESVRAREIVIDLVPPHARAMVRVFTSLAAGASAARDSGEDAIRLLVCVETADGFRKLEQPRKLLRTAPKAATQELREQAFLDRLRATLRSCYGEALHNEPCPLCGRASADRGKFRGCSGFPLCRGTVAQRIYDPR